MHQTHDSQSLKVINRKLFDNYTGQGCFALKTRLNRDVILDCSVDKTLLGGAIVRAGDLVIDGWALGKLNKLANVLN